MKKATVFTLGILCAFVLFTSTAFAWDDLIAITSGSKIGEPGNAWAGALLRYSTAGDSYDKDGESQELADDATGLRIPIIGTYTFMEKLDTFAILPIVSMDDGNESESGIGDIWLGAKYAVMEDGLLTIRGALDIPTGDDEKGLGNAGGFGLDVAALTGKEINDQVNVGGGVGIRMNGEDSDTEWAPGMAFYVHGGVDYKVTEQIPVWVGLTYFNQGDGEFSGNEVSDSTVNWLDLNIGGAYNISEDLFAGAGIDYTLTGTNTDADLGISVWAGYHIMK